MAKKKRSTKAKDDGKKKKKKRKTIQSVVLKCLAKDENMSVEDIREVLVENGMEKSKFNVSHLAWYKYQVRKGNLELPNGKQLSPSTRGRKKKADKDGKSKDKKSKGKKKGKKKNK